jgi:hypothetical protein
MTDTPGAALQDNAISAQIHRAACHIVFPHAAPKNAEEAQLRRYERARNLDQRVAPARKISGKVLPYHYAR